jgi:prefoldin subunit 5
MMEIGAGYFLEENTSKAKDQCDRKLKMLSESTTKLAQVIDFKKQQTMRVVQAI